MFEYIILRIVEQVIKINFFYNSRLFFINPRLLFHSVFLWFLREYSNTFYYIGNPILFSNLQTRITISDCFVCYESSECISIELNGWFVDLLSCSPQGWDNIQDTWYKSSQEVNDLNFEHLIFLC